MKALQVDNLSKSYLVGHNAVKSGTSDTFRETIARNAKNLARKTRDMLTGRLIVQGDEVEERWALKDITTKSSPGDNVDIIGRNGAGKSTLLKIFSPTVRRRRSVPLNI
jgi:lipopolysaccharide transport system ATP-binding protein